MQAVLLIGIQASGKSTFYRQHFLHTHIRINRDMLKTRRREKYDFINGPSERRFYGRAIAHPKQ